MPKNQTMKSVENRVGDLTREFFAYYPDYRLCNTLAVNVENGVTSYGDALSAMSGKARAAELNREAIAEKLNLRSVNVQGRTVRISELSLGEILRLDRETCRTVVDFYFKHPYAHGRTRKSRWWPRWFRTLFLSTILGHAKRNGIELDYGSCFEILKLL